jgi:RNA polymerase sigma-70 factor (sigma-E family)
MDERDAEFSAFVASRSSALRRYAYLLTGDLASADDLLQDSLLKVYRKWSHIAGPGIDRYVRVVITRTHISVWRHVGRFESPADALADVGLPDRTEEVATRDEVWRLLQGLGPRQRAVVVLRFWQDLPEAEIAATLGISVGTVKSQLDRALAHLRTAQTPHTTSRHGGAR